MDRHNLPEVLKPRDVAELFGVDAKTISRWAKSNKITSFRTPGQHRRFLREDVEELLARETTRRSPAL